MPVEWYLKSEIAEHWVLYIRHDDSRKIVWDRRDYTDFLNDFDLIF